MAADSDASSKWFYTDNCSPMKSKATIAYVHSKYQAISIEF